MYILCIYRLIIKHMGNLADSELCICFPSFVHINFEKNQKKIFFYF